MKETKEIRGTVPTVVKEKFDGALKFHGLTQNQGFEEAMKLLTNKLILRAPESKEILKALS